MIRIAFKGRILLCDFHPRALPSATMVQAIGLMEFADDFLKIFGLIVRRSRARSSYLRRPHQQKGKHEQVREETGCKHRLV